MPEIAKSTVAEMLIEREGIRFNRDHYPGIKTLLRDWDFGLQFRLRSGEPLGTAITSATRRISMTGIVNQDETWDSICNGIVGGDNNTATEIKSFFGNYDKVTVNTARFSTHATIKKLVHQLTIEARTFETIEAPLLVPQLIGGLVMTDLLLAERFGLEVPLTVDLDSVSSLLAEPYNTF